jgi:sn-glycerol 3-phosphate transport system substrate-binding protein
MTSTRDPQRSTRCTVASKLVVALAITLVAAACGGDGGEDDARGGGDSASGDAIAALADCPVGAHEEGDDPVEVTVWHAYNALTQETLEQVAADYNRSQERVTVRVEAQGTYEELLAKYETAIGDPRTLPDVIFSEDTTTQFMIDSGTVVPAASCIGSDPGAEEFFNDVVPSVTTAYTVQGALWPAAFGVSMPVMYVNDDHLRAAGLSDDDYPGTLDELRVAAERIRDAGLPGMDAPVVMTLNGWFLENWLTGAGELVVDRRNGREGLATSSEFDSPATLEAFEWIRSMSEDGLLKTFPAAGGFDHYFSLARQNSSILIDGSRAITSITAVIDGARSEIAGVEAGQLDDRDLQGLDVDVAPIVGLEGPGMGAVAGSAGYLVAGGDDAVIAGGWDFLKFFNSIDNQVRWTLQGSYLPVTASAQDDPRLVEEFSATRSGRWLATAYEQLRTLDADFPPPVMGPYKEFRSGVQAAMESVAAGRSEPAQAIGQFDRRFSADLRNYAEEVGG